MRIAVPLRLAALVGVASLTSCLGVGINADVGYSQMVLSGEMSLAPSVGSLPASTIDVGNDLGLDDATGSPYARADAALGIVGLTLSGFGLEQSGVGTLSASFGDIPASTTVATDLQLYNLKAVAVLDILHLGPVRLSPGLGVDVFDLDLDMRSTTFGLSESIDEVLPVPILCAQAAVDLGPFSALADLGGIYLSTGDVEGSFVDFELTARFQPLPNLEVFAGYRLILIDADGNPEGQDFSADLTVQGVVFGGGISF
jgi:hypothetical protein